MNWRPSFEKFEKDNWCYEVSIRYWFINMNGKWIVGHRLLGFKPRFEKII